MLEQTVKTDIVVVGGGLSGVCAAVAAARLGQTVSLVQNRPVLGGNSSSEVRVWVCGATGHGVNRYARETGIMGELFVENQYRNMEGNPYYWDLVVLETVRAEPNIQLFLNTDVHEVEAEGPAEDRIITAVTGWMMGSERRIRFEGDVVLDCTGDGLVGFLAGAKYRIGREAKAEFNEDWAPEIADDITLGSTILFYSKDMGRPIKYVPPSFAKDITQTSIPVRRVIRSGDSGCHYWWIEWGGELDTVHENERIRDELWSVIYGIWDFIKNSGQFEADNMTLEWVGSLPGKREYRRFVGDYMLNQNDVVEQRAFDDKVAFGGWSIDLHPPQGMYAVESGSKHFYADGNYAIPFRSLYSANVRNLLFAGRNISASHVAFGTTRVMATCAVIGEAAGTGAALCVKKGVTPRTLQAEHMGDLQQTLLRQDAAVIGLRNADPLDLARATAAVEASSTLSLAQWPLHGTGGELVSHAHALEKPVGILVPVDPRLDGVELLVDAEEATELVVEVWETGREENYIPHRLLSRHSCRVEQGAKQWAAVDGSGARLQSAPCNVFLVVRENARLRLHAAEGTIFGMLGFEYHGDLPIDELPENSQRVTLWRTGPFNRKAVCVKLSPGTKAYAADKAVDGYVRPFGGPHLWMSDVMEEGREEWLRLQWPSPVGMREIHLTFNDDVNEDLINLHHHTTPFPVMPDLVKDCRIEALTDEGWTVLERIQDNRKRKRVIALPAAVAASALRIVVESTNGSPFAQVIEVRVYGQ
ncbi:FAD-dependent oxidoreductase [Paenibacillus rhizovicinus]|uniref:FAD-dependent oxidoreductase n=1 Tax=Paenibacillus rhizovicinus TaxID=2704463 RepID=A0A6C0NZQ9_9BACL|nr:FAD-dependent oxidoreductase [Paenibacillus rhizovicinus]QHW31750.1 FAD-dependent oxidoreductase [Paenibacillus rhizovicinus]